MIDGNPTRNLVAVALAAAFLGGTDRPSVAAEADLICEMYQTVFLDGHARDFPDGPAVLGSMANKDVDVNAVDGDHMAEAFTQNTINGIARDFRGSKFKVDLTNGAIHPITQGKGRVLARPDSLEYAKILGKRADNGAFGISIAYFDKTSGALSALLNVGMKVEGIRKFAFLEINGIDIGYCQE